MMTKATNISSGTGARYFQVYYSATFTADNVLILPLLTGFYITSSNYYSVLVTGTMVSRYNYLVNVTTSDDSVVHRVDFYLLFCN